MPNTEWWREFVTHIDYTDDEPFGVLVERVPQLLAHHRKMIVKEIREEIEGVWSDSVFHQDMTSTLKLMGSNEMRSAILSLPCLKENE